MGEGIRKEKNSKKPKKIKEWHGHPVISHVVSV